MFGMAYSAGCTFLPRVLIKLLPCHICIKNSVESFIAPCHFICKMGSKYFWICILRHYVSVSQNISQRGNFQKYHVGSLCRIFKNLDSLLFSPDLEVNTLLLIPSGVAFSSDLDTVLMVNFTKVWFYNGILERI